MFSSQIPFLHEIKCPTLKTQLLDQPPPFKTLIEPPLMSICQLSLSSDNSAVASRLASLQSNIQIFGSYRRHDIVKLLYM